MERVSPAALFEKAALRSGLFVGITFVARADCCDGDRCKQRRARRLDLVNKESI